ncbi:hypothetical protein ASG47_03145 [Devosia sp. Leaf420]|uniref:hypothetical protein n=1 Tax=Devosia sp. Leaf420 TaxID=1736374 RepID=UPI000716129C|nr:hypothetical protein [Devosia sp. Leaf420]KQT49350.1 hypothetical protein ASG47_03145 [Devosia sp. Leaf420]
MTEIIALGLIALTSLIVLQRMPLISALSFFVLHNMAACICLYIVCLNGLDKYDFVIAGSYFSAMPMEGLSSIQLQVYIVVLLLNVVSIASMIGSPNVRAMQRGRTRSVLRQEFTRGGQIDRVMSSPAAALIIAFFVIVTCFHFASIDRSVLWYNTSYLAIKTPEELGLNDPITEVYHILMRVVGLAAIVVTTFYVAVRRYFFAAFSFFLFIYSFTIMLAGNSRWVPLYLFLSAVASIVIRKKGSLYSYLCFALGFFFFAVVINGRGRGEFGMSIVLDNIAQTNISEIGTYLSGSAINALEFALNLANSIDIAPVFSENYQLLSFSPLLSSMDGFDGIMGADKAKFALHVPMGGLGEVVHFGIFYQLLYAVALFSMLRMSWRVFVKCDFLTAIMLNIASIYVLYIMPNYSIRTTFRFELAIIAVSFVLIRIQKNGRKSVKSDASIRPALQAG